jgi:hypothetical protein
MVEAVHNPPYTLSTDGDGDVTGDGDAVLLEKDETMTTTAEEEVEEVEEKERDSTTSTVTATAPTGDISSTTQSETQVAISSKEEEKAQALVEGVHEDPVGAADTVTTEAKATDVALQAEEATNEEQACPAAALEEATELKQEERVKEEQDSDVVEKKEGDEAASDDACQGQGQGLVVSEKSTPKDNTDEEQNVEHSPAMSSTDMEVEVEVEKDLEHPSVTNNKSDTKMEMEVADKSEPHKEEDVLQDGLTAEEEEKSKSEESLDAEVEEEEEEEEEEEVWDIVRAFTSKERADAKKHNKCMGENCKAVAMVEWSSNLEPGTPYFYCEPCQEQEFGGWPEGFKIPKGIKDADVDDKKSSPKSKKGKGGKDKNKKDASSDDAPSMEEEVHDGDGNAIDVKINEDVDNEDVNEDSSVMTPSPSTDHKVGEAVDPATANGAEDGADADDDNGEEGEDNGEGEEEEDWVIEKAFSVAELKKARAQKCNTPGCSLVACVKWVRESCKETWYTCVE